MKSFKNFLVEGRKGKSVKPPGKLDKKGGYYETTEDTFIKWYNKLGLDDVVSADVVIETGEVVMEKGQSRRKILKKSKKLHVWGEWSDKSFEAIKDRAKEKLDAPFIYDFERDMDSFYDLKMEDIHKVAGIDDPEKFGEESNYDTFGSMPAEIKRKDGFSFKDNDLTNIKGYIQHLNKRNKRDAPGVVFVAHPTKGSKVVKTDVQFH